MQRANAPELPDPVCQAVPLVAERHQETPRDKDNLILLMLMPSPPSSRENKGDAHDDRAQLENASDCDPYRRTSLSFSPSLSLTKMLGDSVVLTWGIPHGLLSLHR
jgi:hypothetical protein